MTKRTIRALWCTLNIFCGLFVLSCGTGRWEYSTGFSGNKVESPWPNLLVGTHTAHGDTYGKGEYWIVDKYLVKRPSRFVLGPGTYDSPAASPVPARYFNDERPTWLTVYSYTDGIRIKAPDKTWRLVAPLTHSQ